MPATTDTAPETTPVITSQDQVSPDRPTNMTETHATSAVEESKEEALQAEDGIKESEAPTRTPLQRSETADVFLGPDGAAPSTAAIESTHPILRITLMLTTGARHPYTISNKYLTSRKVTATDDDGKFDPREISAYKLKELIWTDWRPEWEPRPADPAAIRLIILGRMLEDNSKLKDSPFSLTNTNVVHMTVKPADLLDDEAEGAGKHTAQSLRRRGLSEGESAGCCRCVLQ